MANLKEVRIRINSVSSTQQITKAMKLVAASKLKRAQDRIIQLRPYANKMSEILNRVGSASENIPYCASRESNKILIVVISSDRGLCGAFNANIFKAVSKLLSEDFKEQVAANNVTLMTLGKKSTDFFSKRTQNIETKYSTVFSNLTFENAREAAEYSMDSFVAGTYDRVYLVYNEFKNVATQILKVDQFLPVDSEKLLDGKVAINDDTDYIFEPSKEEIVQDLFPKSLKIKFYKALLESFASEQGARMMAMEKATDNAGELLKQLKLTYNRTRQAAITTEILEIAAGAEALKGN